MKLSVKKGDITEEQVDVIVNAANISLMPGGGVDAAITTAAGEEALADRLTIGGCQTGAAEMGIGGNLNAKYIIYTVGPRYYQNRNDLLADCYKNSIQLAIDNGLESIAFPAVGAGVYGYPADVAAKIAIDAVIEMKDKDIRVKFVLFTDEVFEAFKNYSGELGLVED